MNAEREIDQEIAEILRLSQGMSNRLRRGQGRSIRPGRNSLRRMKTGTLVREHRRQVNDDRRPNRDTVNPDVQRAAMLALAQEFNRRGLEESAAAIENQEQAQEATTHGGQQAQEVIEQAQAQRTANEDFEGTRLENLVDERVAELGGKDLPVVTERDTTALTSEELAEDLIEVEASPDAYDALAFSADINGHDPQQGFDSPHPETLEFEAITPEQLSHSDDYAM